MTSPAERYARSRSRAEFDRTPLAKFAAGYEFGLDDFQLRACTSLGQGNGVLVAAPTGAGKTIVGEFAIHLALESGQKCFYTTPIKALSNQKYRDLVERHGEDAVGLLTGDVTINGEAPIVVMTTEVLRNMLYAGSTTLRDLAYVVMDEVHYLADRFRGAVWEEVIIHLPARVTVVALSATVSNAEEFGAWLAAVRGNTDVIVEEHRPVPLWQHVMVGTHLHDLFADEHQRIVNPELVRLARDEDKLTRPVHGRRKGRPRRSRSTPWRSDVVDRLDRESLLPVIYFLFSRAGCDEAVSQCLNAGLRLTDSDERREIRAAALAATLSIAEEDLYALGFDEWLEALERGIAAHHAGLLPVFKEVIEGLFQRGLVKAIFATETLALGINMPAKSVVLERLVKWNGETHVDLTPGEYTQLTGRAGRRGIDIEGHAVVLWQAGLEPGSLAGLASTRTYPLRSSFQPSYNMAVNLVSRMGRRPAREVLETSFAQFQADRAVVGIATELRKAEEARDGYRESMDCHLGDFAEYAAMRDELSQLEKGLGKLDVARRREEAADSWASLMPGDVITIPVGRRSGPALVLDQQAARQGRDEGRPLVLTAEGQVRRLSQAETSQPVHAYARMRLPKGFAPRDPRARRELADALDSTARSVPASERKPPSSKRSEDSRITSLRTRLRQHPCHGCSDREAHARWAERLHRANRHIEDLDRRIASRTSSIARRFDRVCDVLDDLGFLRDVDGETEVTDAGTLLMKLYTENDLLTATCILEGAWDDLTPLELAAVASAIVFEPRQLDEEAAVPFPSARVRDAVRQIASTWAGLKDAESRYGLSTMRKPDGGIVDITHRWARGGSLLEVLTHADITAGDFVRWMKQVIDLLGQVAQAVDSSSPLRMTADQAVDLLARGVVSAQP